MKSGVYRILNKITGKFYIGSSIDMIKRCNQHVWHLVNNCHSNKYLQASWNKHGYFNFEFAIVETCCLDLILEREQFYIDDLKPEYNMLKIAGSTLGSKRSEETKAKMSAWQIGRIMSDEARNKMREMARDYDKWPCTDGISCKCKICLPKMREYKKLKAREYRAR